MAGKAEEGKMQVVMADEAFTPPPLVTNVSLSYVSDSIVVNFLYVDPIQHASANAEGLNHVPGKVVARFACSSGVFGELLEKLGRGWEAYLAERAPSKEEIQKFLEKLQESERSTEEGE